MQVQLLVWIFMMRIVMVVASGGSYLLNEVIAKGQYQNADKMNYEAPLTRLVWLTSIVSVVLTYVASYLLIPTLGGDDVALVEALDGHHLRHAGRRDHPRARQGLHVHRVGARARGRDVVARRAARRSTSCPGFVAGNFSAYWLGMAIMVLMGDRLLRSARWASATSA